MTSGKTFRALMLVLAALAALVAFFMIDDILLYLLFDRLLELEVTALVRGVVAFVIFLLNLGLALAAYQALRRKPTTGREGMIGETGVVSKVEGAKLWVKLHGELWRAEGHGQLSVGDRVTVTNMRGLLVHVEPCENHDNSSRN